MNRSLFLKVALGALTLLTIGADKPPREVFQSLRSPADATACLADQIRGFDSPQVSPSAGGRTRIVTRIMHVTRIDLTVVPGERTTIELRSRPSKKLRQILAICQAPAA